MSFLMNFYFNFGFSFSDVIYIDATNKQTLEVDLQSIGGVEQSAEASLRWLANESDGQWMLLFDNADDVDLDLSAFFPSCTSGNILITSRNRELRHYTTEDSSQYVRGMEHDDATKLLLRLSQAATTNENKELAEQIVQVFLSFLFLEKTVKLRSRTQELHHFALAVSQAGAFIHCHSSLSR
jgi:LPS O-antigen subunit length determinant protein (WzzB/FepE family)